MNNNIFINLSEESVPKKSNDFLGHHVLIEFFECNPDTMLDSEKVQEALRLACQAAGCNIVSEHYHSFEPNGISGVTILSESHGTVHSWREHQYAAVDLFYCSDYVEIQKAIEFLKDFFESKNIKYLSIDRGRF